MSVATRAAIAAFAILVLSPASVSVAAWGAVGHRVVARIAWAHVTPAAQARATVLLEGGQDAFVLAATWADEVRSLRPESYNWHFVDIPVAESKYVAGRDCPPTERGDCVIAAIARIRVELAEAGRSAAENLKKAEALKFLIHFVGDMHQPLHATDNHDRGGNDVKVSALRGEDGRATNLHAAWDTGLINLSTETEAARAERLLAVLRANPLPPPVLALDVVQWAEEIHELGTRVVYRYPSFAPTGPGPEVITLDEAYRAAATTTIDRQLQLAGARLAALVNALLK